MATRSAASMTEARRRCSSPWLKRSPRSARRNSRIPSSFFPYSGEEIKRFFELLKDELSPDLIFTHCRKDLHQDHRVISELTWNTFRNHSIFEYEIPKYDGDLGPPNVFMPLRVAHAHRKVLHLMEHFASQRARGWYGEDTFNAVLRLRGLECNAPERLAEAFYCRKLVIGGGD